MTGNNNKKEYYTITGDRLVEKVKELIHEGNVRKIVIRDKNDNAVAEFPLTLGVVGAVIAPILAAIGALAALMTECKIEVEKTSKKAKNR